MLHQVETAAAAGDVARARGLADQFAHESAAAIAYIRRVREGAAD